MTTRLIHARKRCDDGTRLVGVAACGSVSRRTDDDKRVTCARCVHALERLRDLGVRISDRTWPLASTGGDK